MASYDLKHLAASVGSVIVIMGALGGMVKYTGGDLPPYAPKRLTYQKISQLSDAFVKAQAEASANNQLLTSLVRDHWRQIERDAESDLLVNPKSPSALRDRDTAACEINAIDRQIRDPKC